MFNDKFFFHINIGYNRQITLSEINVLAIIAANFPKLGYNLLGLHRENYVLMLFTENKIDPEMLCLYHDILHLEACINYILTEDRNQLSQFDLPIKTNMPKLMQYKKILSIIGEKIANMAETTYIINDNFYNLFFKNSTLLYIETKKPMGEIKSSAINKFLQENTLGIRYFVDNNSDEMETNIKEIYKFQDHKYITISYANNKLGENFDLHKLSI